MNHQIITIGKDLSSTYLGLKEFGPDFIHLLITDQTETCYEPLVSMLPQGMEFLVYRVNPYDGMQVQETCRSIHDHFSGTISYNLSEGTKIMALAALEVAREKQAKAFYITQDGYLIDLPSFTRTPLQMSMDNEEFIRLSGNNCCSYQNLDNLTSEDVQSAVAIKHFIENHHKEHDRIQRYYSQRFHRHLGQLPQSFALEDKLYVRTYKGTLFIEKGNQHLLQLKSANSCFLYFEGRWWETLVADQVNQWRNRIKANHPQTDLLQTWQSVIFGVSDDPQRNKNEIDILLNGKQKLIIIECKSGYITQDNIYHIDAVRETYGGDISQAVLASYYPLENALLEKCKDLHIHVFAPKSDYELDHFYQMLPAWLDQVRKDLEI